MDGVPAQPRLVRRKQEFFLRPAERTVVYQVDQGTAADVCGFVAGRKTKQESGKKNSRGVQAIPIRPLLW